MRLLQPKPQEHAPARSQANAGGSSDMTLGALRSDSWYLPSITKVHARDAHRLRDYSGVICGGTTRFFCTRDCGSSTATKPPYTES